MCLWILLLFEQDVKDFLGCLGAVPLDRLDGVARGCVLFVRIRIGLNFGIFRMEVLFSKF